MSPLQKCNSIHRLIYPVDKSKLFYDSMSPRRLFESPPRPLNKKCRSLSRRPVLSAVVEACHQQTQSAYPVLCSAFEDSSPRGSVPVCHDAISFILAKKTLSQLSKHEDLNNKVCFDCSNPNHQWASLRYYNVNFTKISPN